MAKRSSYIGTFAAITWGWIVALLVLLVLEGFGAGNFRQVWGGLTKSLPLLFFFFCLPLLAFAGSVLLAIRMSRGDLRDRPLAVVLLVIGIPWALFQSFALLAGL